MSRSFRWIGLVGLIALAGLVSSLSAAAAPAAAAAPTIGVLDLDVLSREYDGYKAAMDRMNTFVEAKNEIYKDLVKGLGLSEAEFETYKKLVGSTTKIDPVKIDELQTKAAAAGAELQTLNEKDEKDLTPDDKTRKEALDADMKAVSELLKSEGNKLGAQIQTEHSRYTAILMKQVDAAIAAIAKKKNCTMVVSKNVQTQEGGSERFVLYGGVDITDDVKKQLNDNFKPSMLDAKP